MHYGLSGPLPAHLLDTLRQILAHYVSDEVYVHGHLIDLKYLFECLNQLVLRLQPLLRVAVLPSDVEYGVPEVQRLMPQEVCKALRRQLVCHFSQVE